MYIFIYICVYIYTCIYTHLGFFRPSGPSFSAPGATGAANTPPVCVCAFVYVCVRMCVCLHAFVRVCPRFDTYSKHPAFSECTLHLFYLVNSAASCRFRMSTYGLASIPTSTTPPSRFSSELPFHNVY